MIEQINIALGKKDPGISQPGSLKPAVGDNVEKSANHQLKVMKNEHPAFFPNGTMIQIHLLRGAYDIDFVLPLS